MFKARIKLYIKRERIEIRHTGSCVCFLLHRVTNQGQLNKDFLRFDIEASLKYNVSFQ